MSPRRTQTDLGQAALREQHEHPPTCQPASQVCSMTRGLDRSENTVSSDEAVAF